MTKQRCIAFGCENEKRQGTFVDDLCAPCYEALTTGVTKHGTSFIFKQADEIERLRDLLERWLCASSEFDMTAWAREVRDAIEDGPSVLEEAFAKESERSIVEAALKRIADEPNSSPTA